MYTTNLYEASPWSSLYPVRTVCYEIMHVFVCMCVCLLVCVSTSCVCVFYLFLCVEGRRGFVDLDGAGKKTYIMSADSPIDEKDGGYSSIGIPLSLSRHSYIVAATIKHHEFIFPA